MSLLSQLTQMSMGQLAVTLFQDFGKFDSSRSEVQDIDKKHFDLYLVHRKSLMGFLQNPHLFK
ncbi:hypothetical protein C5G87_08810 [Paenibacillus peoriae]|nr:hypothetical protein PPYC1_14625 [Paenibacillus polymyxa]PPQ49443.1 hypothetical protein C5G87_08810 [Paenibacillus peoriae]